MSGEKSRGRMAVDIWACMTPLLLPTRRSSLTLNMLPMRCHANQGALHTLLNPDQQATADGACTELVKHLHLFCRHQRVHFRVKTEKEGGDKLAELHPGDTAKLLISSQI